MTTFGSLIRSYRLRAGLGLRTFAALIEERASVVSAIESGRRAPWRRDITLRRVAEVLGLVETSNLWQKILDLARTDPTKANGESLSGNRVAWWQLSDDATQLDQTALVELAEFLGTSLASDTAQENFPSTAPLTELAIEWRVRKLLGQREVPVAAAPVDVEAVLENEAQVRLEIIPGLIPRFSVQACVATAPNGLTFFIDRIVADSRPIASYRYLLALLFAPVALWEAESRWQASLFRQWSENGKVQAYRRDGERFALAMLLPANPVLAGAESAYHELIQQQGWVEVDDAARALRNRLAEQFAVPTTLVHRRLLGWPCHLYGRVAQALAAQESTLPPLDWILDEQAPRQRTLFDKSATLL